MSSRGGSTVSASSSGSFGLPMVLFLIFLVLKLCGVIDWSWWWVTSPLWISALIGIVIAAVCVVVGLWQCSKM